MYLTTLLADLFPKSLGLNHSFLNSYEEQHSCGRG